MLTLQKKQGNLIDFKVDFIVNASNTTLRLGSGVSMILKRACGSELQAEMDVIRQEFSSKKEYIQQGDVLATRSFELLNTKYILHAAVIDYNPGIKQFEGKPTLKTIQNILENCIPYLKWFESEYSKIPVISFPYIGCGVGGLKKEDVYLEFSTFVEKYKDKVNASILLIEFN